CAQLAPVVGHDDVGVEPQVLGVVAQEALRVDRARELAELARFQGGEVARPDLRITGGSFQFDALALARHQEDLSELARRGHGRPALHDGDVLLAEPFVPVTAIAVAFAAAESRAVAGRIRAGLPVGGHAVGGHAVAAPGSVAAQAACQVLPRGALARAAHRSGSSSSWAASRSRRGVVASRRSTARAFEPSKGPT